ncbi:MAG: class I SAM-dependent methyltransferase [Chloroflexaceae bacterium]|nr:class I SAM-dependent methyltransferase [Chloroflexaceae bacterium]
MRILDQYRTTAPSPQHALDIFQGEWSSRLPPPFDHLRAGTIPLFEDIRILWGLAQIGGVRKKTVLELGPLEGGHTYMLQQYGAASITAIEANTRAYLKCLIVKELLRLDRAHVLCGDFLSYLHATNDRYDVCLASGVLYHMPNPVELIALIAQTASQLMLWTHYYDHAVLSTNPALAPKFPGSEMADYAGFKHTLYRFEYQVALEWQGFCGGSAPHSNWLSRDDLLAALRYFGFHDLRLQQDQTDHPNGPCLLLTARRT